MVETETVHIIDDDDGLREALDLLIRSAGYSTAMYAGLDEFAPEAVGATPSCVLLDVRMPGANGLEFQERLAREGSGLSVIMMTGHGDIPMSVRAMKAGAIDFLPKPFDDEQMLSAIAVAIARDRERTAERRANSDLTARYASLSPRERQVMALVTAGKLNKQSAYELGLSEVTVKVHRRAAMTKMQAATLADLVRMAEVLQFTTDRPSSESKTSAVPPGSPPASTSA